MSMKMRKLWILFVPFFLASCGSPEVRLGFNFSVVNWSPHDGASGIERDWRPSVCLSMNVDDSTLDDNAALYSGEIDSQTGLPDNKEKITTEIILSPSDNACIIFENPNASSNFLLDYDQTYFMVLEKDLASEDGSLLGRRVYSRFRTVENAEN